jgi:peptide deformylase
LPVSEFEVEVLARMKELMSETDGKKTRLVCVGMAAPQIGVGSRMFLYCPASPSIRLAEKVSRDLIEVFNPEILSHGKEEVIMPEGCVSDPFFFAPVKRYQVIEVGYFDRWGTPVCKKLTGWEARVFQHEVDHLNGKLCRFRHQELSAHSVPSSPQ